MLCKHFMLYLFLQDFYEDLFEELSKYGDIESLNVCDNLADHMVIFLFCSFELVSDCLRSNWYSYHEFFGRLAMFMYSLERKSMLQMLWKIWLEDFMLVMNFLFLFLSVELSDSYYLSLLPTSAM